jgi:hypothetical protein
VEPRRGPEERLDEVRALGNKVLAVVQQQQDMAGAEVFGKHVGDRAVRPLAHAQCGCDRLGNEAVF